MITLRSAIAGLPVYTAGKPAPGMDRTPSFKLSSNENPFPPLPGVMEATAAAVAQMNRYPDIANTQMARKLSNRLSVPEEQLAFGTGSVAVLYHLLLAACEVGDEVVYAWRSFEAYPIAVQLTGATQVPVPLAPGAVHDLAAMRRAVTPATKVIMLCTPNNPTGPALHHQQVIDFIDSVPDHIMIVLDEAYAEFITDPEGLRGLDAMAERPNVVVLRTFSKAYGLAGFRVGYCVADPQVAAAVRAVALPFGVSIAAQAAVIASLDAEALLLDRVAELVKARDALAVGLRDLGFEIPDAQGNFVWLPGGPQTDSYAAAFARAGVAVRPYASGGDWDGLRITVGEPAANALVLEVAA
ncbi:MAG TPA: histidinol-phosphate transaminase, partial [Propionibacteriaceae bacterium]|nr:histidinol-phosphate transaminase [Propionibacteriaceae bacterium]